jgi:hypothetical protein
MAVERETALPGVAPAYRGQHGTGAPGSLISSGDWGRVAIIVAAVTALALVAVGAALGLQRSGQTRVLPPVRGVVTAPPLVPVPPVPRPSEAPGQAPTEQPGIPSAPPTTEPSATTTAPTPPTPPVANPVVRPPRPPLRPFSVEAESAANTLSGRARIRSVRAASNGQVITSIGDGSANTLRFNRIVVPADGIYTMVVGYVSAVDRKAAIRVDNDAAVVADFPASGGAAVVGTITLRVRLTRGSNSVEFGNALKDAPDIDQITVRD